MITLISPAKTLELEKPFPEFDYTLPRETTKSAQLIRALKKLKRDEISSLMDLSPNLAQLNFQRYKTWKPEHTLQNSRPAIFTFDGDVYDGFEAYLQNTETILFAQQHLRILSGLYGLLRPLDIIQPYRLEMGTRLHVGKHNNLYQFWGDIPTKMLLADLNDDTTIINLASEEYFKVINTKKAKARIIQPVFMDFKTDQYKVISFFAKRARGLMAAYICRNQINEPETLKNFTESGYYFNADVSTENTWVFYRD